MNTDRVSPALYCEYCKRDCHTILDHLSMLQAQLRVCQLIIRVLDSEYGDDVMPLMELGEFL
jgi:hypothetical protein